VVEVVTIETPGLGDRSYLVHDGALALAVDPQRDIDRILQAADEAGVTITHVAETHIHNDYVSGGLELARRTRAAYLVAAAEDVAFERRPVADGDEIDIGGFRVRVMGTPGHTPHHLAYVVLDSDRPAAVFTGGSLLYGTVGRTDLIGAAVTRDLTRAQFRSARRLASELPDDVAIWPTHGFGSFCSSSRSSSGDASLLREERAHNVVLTTEEEDAFVEQLLAGLTAYPTYYAHMGPMNRQGPPAVDLSSPLPVDGAELRRRIEAGAWVVDLANRSVFAGGHVAGTVSFELGDSFTTHVGWFVPWGAPITLIGDTATDVAEARRALARIGFDRLAGAAIGRRAELAGSEPLASYRVSDFNGLARALDAGEDVVVLDVRRDDERAEGWIERSVHIPLHDLTRRLEELPSGTVWVHCERGFRAGIAASLIDRAGRSVVHVDDDWAAAPDAGLPLSGGSERSHAA
jgi:glyoxylase-like metal-dependent hydrolase (beta-lactamase superfamily II)/rhodanese-related sulfurtransferase